MQESERARGGHHPGVTIGLAAAHAIVFAAAYPGAGWWPLAFIAVTPLYWLAVGAASTRVAAVAVFATQLPMWLWMHRWVIEVTAVGYPLMCLYMALYPVLFVWLIRYVRAHPLIGAWPPALLVPVAWTGLEFLRGTVILDGYPWFLLGHPLVEAPVQAQSADLLGAYFIGFLAAMTGGLVAQVLHGLPERPAVKAWAALGAVALVHAANLSYGAWRLSQRDALSPGPVCLAVQTNLPQSNKIGWSPAAQREDLRGFIDLSVAARDAATAAGAGPDLVIWPETMLPGFGLEPETIRTLVEGGYFPGDDFSSAVTQMARSFGVPLLAGSASFLGLRAVVDRWQWDAHYNSAYLIQGDPPYQRYDKIFLTPFGETMPYISRWPWLERKLLAIGAGGMRFDLDGGTGITRLRMTREARDLTLVTPICFEDTVPAVCRRMVHERGAKAADVVVNLSNDGWFGAHDAGRAQHAQIARFRCIENRVPMMRVVNTGSTVAVDSAGRIIGPRDVGPDARAGSGGAVAARQAGWLLAELPLDRRSTVYGRVGDAWGWMCLLGTAGLGAAAFAARRRGSAR